MYKLERLLIAITYPDDQNLVMSVVLIDIPAIEALPIHTCPDLHVLQLDYPSQSKYCDGRDLDSSRVLINNLSTMVQQDHISLDIDTSRQD